MSILDISKIHMYETFYNYFKAKYGEKVRMCYTDTDSFILEIETEDFYKAMKKDADTMYDMTGFPKEHDLHSEKNKKVLGMFKDELNGDIMIEMAGLGAKTYAYETFPIKREEKTDENPKPKPSLDKNGKLQWEGIDEGKRCKGVKKSVVENKIKLENYKNCLKTKKDCYRTMPVLRSREHEMHTEVINKKALSFADDKRYILPDGIETLAWGHHRIKKLTEEEKIKYEQQGARPKTY